MLVQGASEVIVVDYSCPEDTGQFVAANFPSARVVSVPGEEHFSNWKARNAGAAVASSELLVFVDADTILADAAIDRLSADLPPRTYGFFDSKTSRAFNAGGPRLASNQLKGFHVIPALAFRRAGGYDEVLEGYAAGADTDLEERLQMIGLARHPLVPALINSVIQHDAPSRTQHHAYPVRTSYAAGLLYRAAKRALLRARGKVELPLRVRQELYTVAKNAAITLGSNSDRIGMTVVLGKEAIMMPRQLGYEQGALSLSLRVDVELEGRLTEIAD